MLADAEFEALSPVQFAFEAAELPVAYVKLRSAPTSPAKLKHVNQSIQHNGGTVQTNFKVEHLDCQTEVFYFPNKQEVIHL